jgi:hypothetical protein
LDESSAEPSPPKPKPPEEGAGLLSFFVSGTGTGSAGLTAGLEGAAGFAPKALCPNPLDAPNALPDLTAPPDPNGLAPLSAGLDPNEEVEAPKPTGFEAPNPANPPVEGTDPNALAVEAG